jgi:hypothetical protein
MMVRVEIENIEHDLSYPVLACVILGGTQILEGVLEFSGEHGRELSDGEGTGECSVLQRGESLVHISTNPVCLDKEVAGVIV